MKKLTYFVLSAAICSLVTIKASAQGQSRSVSGFNAVASGGPFNVYIKIDGNESVKVDADEDIINEIETVVEGNTLKIGFKDRFSHRHNNIRKANIYVEAKSLQAVTSAGSGGMKVEGTASAENFKAILSGSGNISTAVKASRVNAVISGSGNIKLSGNTDDADLVVTGSGEISGQDLKANDVRATITGSGNIHVQAEKSVSSHITGSGNVIYSGSATNVSSHTTGSGRTSKE